MTDRRRARIERLFKIQERAARLTAGEARRFHHAVVLAFSIIWIALAFDLAFVFNSIALAFDLAVVFNSIALDVAIDFRFLAME